MNILVVCSGNLCRSPMAEAVLQRRLMLSATPCKVSSAGTLGIEGHPAARHAVTACEERGLDLAAFRSRALSQELLMQADLVVCMEPMHLETCQRLSLQGGPRMKLLGSALPLDDKLLPGGGVRDPVGQGLDEFRHCLELLIRLCDHLLAQEKLLPYTPYYCEENVWQLLHDERLRPRERWALVISNPARQVALWAQRASPVAGAPVVWDYHVVALVKDLDDVVVWDLDSLGPCPATFADWYAQTVEPTLVLSEEFQPSFRLVPADDYLHRFSSTRAHMRGDDGAFLAAPPPWPCIVAAGDPLTLTHLLERPAEEPSAWFTAAALCAHMKALGEPRP
ncbi:MAG: hypothetical protein ACO3JL_08305 [Myxococcota bacterium]